MNTRSNLVTNVAGFCHLEDSRQLDAPVISSLDIVLYCGSVHEFRLLHLQFLLYTCRERGPVQKFCEGCSRCNAGVQVLVEWPICKLLFCLSEELGVTIKIRAFW